MKGAISNLLTKIYQRVHNAQKINAFNRAKKYGQLAEKKKKIKNLIKKQKQAAKLALNKKQKPRIIRPSVILRQVNGVVYEYHLATVFPAPIINEARAILGLPLLAPKVKYVRAIHPLTKDGFTFVCNARRARFSIKKVRRGAPQPAIRRVGDELIFNIKKNDGQMKSVAIPLAKNKFEGPLPGEEEVIGSVKSDSYSPRVRQIRKKEAYLNNYMRYWNNKRMYEARQFRREQAALKKAKFLQETRSVLTFEERTVLVLRLRSVIRSLVESRTGIIQALSNYDKALSELSATLRLGRFGQTNRPKLGHQMDCLNKFKDAAAKMKDKVVVSACSAAVQANVSKIKDEADKLFEQIKAMLPDGLDGYTAQSVLIHIMSILHDIREGRIGKGIGLNVVGILSNLKLVQGKTFYLATLIANYFRWAKDKLEHEAEGGSSDVNINITVSHQILEHIEAPIATLTIFIASLFNLKLGPKDRIPNFFSLRNIKNFTSTANSATIFVKNHLESLLKCFEWCHAKVNKYLFDRVIADQPADLRLFLNEANTLVHDAKWQSDLMNCPIMQHKLFRLSIQAAKISSLTCESSRMTPLHATVRQIISKISQLQERLIADCIAPNIGYEPWVIQFSGPPGTGKSTIVSKMVPELLTSIGYKTINEMVYTRYAGVDFWNGINNQPFIAYDDVFIEEQSSHTQLVEWMQLKSPIAFNPNCAHLEDKKRKISPLGMIVNCNRDYFYNMNFIYEPEAVHRRRDMLWYVDFKGMQMGVTNEKARAKIRDQLRNDRVRTGSTNFDMYEFRQAIRVSDATVMSTFSETNYGPPMNFQKFMEITKLNFKQYRKSELIAYEERFKNLTRPDDSDEILQAKKVDEIISDRVRKYIENVEKSDPLSFTRTMRKIVDSGQCSLYGRDALEMNEFSNVETREEKIKVITTAVENMASSKKEDEPKEKSQQEIDKLQLELYRKEKGLDSNGKPIVKEPEPMPSTSGIEKIMVNKTTQAEVTPRNDLPPSKPEKIKEAIYKGKGKGKVVHRMYIPKHQMEEPSDQEISKTISILSDPTVVSVDQGPAVITSEQVINNSELQTITTEDDETFAHTAGHQYLHRTVLWHTDQTFDTELLGDCLPGSFFVTGEFSNSLNSAVFRVYKYYRFDLEVKIMINCSKMNFGKLLAAWQYCYNDSHLERAEINKNSQLVQGPHAFLTASNNSVVTFEIPYKYVWPMIAMNPEFKLTNFCKLYIKVFNPLRCYDTASSTASVSVLFRFKNMNKAGLYYNLSVKHQMEAALTSLATAGVEHLLRYLFSDSNRDNPSDPRTQAAVIPWGSHSWAHGTNASEIVNILRLDPLATTPHFDIVDQMQVKYITSIYGFVNIYSWRSSQEAVEIFCLPVSPIEPFNTTEYRSSSFDPSKNLLTTYRNTPLSVISSLYSFWRGSISYRFDFVSSFMMTGRVLVCFIPSNDKELDVSFFTYEKCKTFYGIYFDLAEETSFTFEVPYISDKPWMNTEPKYLDCRTGYIKMFIVNRLQSGSMASAIDINVFVKAGDKFELAVPCLPRSAPSFDRTYLNKVIEWKPEKEITWQDSPDILITQKFATGQFKKDDGKYTFVRIVSNDNSTNTTKYSLWVTARPLTIQQQGNSLPGTSVYSWTCHYVMNFNFPPNGSKSMNGLIPLNIVTIEDEEEIWSIITTLNKNASDALYYTDTQKLVEKLGLRARLVSLVFQTISFDVTETYSFFGYEGSFDLTEVTPLTFQMDDRRNDSLSLTVAQTQPTTSMSFFNENFSDLKDLMRRYQFYTTVDIKLQKKIIGKAATRVPIMISGIQMDLTSDSASKDREAQIYNQQRGGLIPLINSGFRFYRGGLRLKFVFNCVSQTTFLVTFVHDRKVSVQAQSALTNVPHSFALTGYPIYGQSNTVNPIVEIEVPYYRRNTSLWANRIANNTAYQHALGYVNITPIGVTTEETATCEIFYAFADDSRLTTFQGFPTTLNVENVPVPPSLTATEARKQSDDEEYELLDLEPKHQMFSALKVAFGKPPEINIGEYRLRNIYDFVTDKDYLVDATEVAETIVRDKQGVYPNVIDAIALECKRKEIKFSSLSELSRSFVYTTIKYSSLQPTENVFAAISMIMIHACTMDSMDPAIRPKTVKEAQSFFAVDVYARVRYDIPAPAEFDKDTLAGEGIQEKPGMEITEIVEPSETTQVEERESIASKIEAIPSTSTAQSNQFVEPQDDIDPIVEIAMDYSKCKHKCLRGQDPTDYLFTILEENGKSVEYFYKSESESMKAGSIDLDPCFEKPCFLDQPEGQEFIDTWLKNYLKMDPKINLQLIPPQWRHRVSTLFPAKEVLLDEEKAKKLVSDKDIKEAKSFLSKVRDACSSFFSIATLKKILKWITVALGIIAAAFGGWTVIKSIGSGGGVSHHSPRGELVQRVAKIRNSNFTRSAFGKGKSSYGFPTHHMQNNVNDVIQVAQNNLYELLLISKPDSKGVITHEGSCKVLGVANRLFIGIKHFFDKARRLSEKGYYVSVVLQNQTFKQTIRFEDLSLYPSENSSLELFVVPSSGFKPMRDLLRHIASEKDHEYAPKKFCLLDYHASRFRQVDLLVQPKEGLVVPKDGYFEEVRIPFCYKYEFGYPGACGAVLISRDGIPKIFGIHIAGVNNNPHMEVGFSEPITQESIPSEVYDHQMMYEEIEGVDTTLSVIKPLVQIPENVEIIGTVDKHAAVHGSTKSEKIQTAIYNEIYESRSCPAPLRTINGVDPMSLALSKYSQIPGSFNDKILKRCSQDVYETLITFCKPLLLTKRQWLTDNEIFSGIPAFKSYPSINLQSSEGYPLMFLRNDRDSAFFHFGKDIDKSGKHWLFDYDLLVDGRRLKSIHPVLEHIMENNQALREERIIPNTIFITTLKDQVIEIEKAEAGKNRIFSNAPIQNTWAVKKYFGHWQAAYTNARFNNESAIGINCDSLEWSELFQRLVEKGSHIITGDYKAFGDTLSRQCMWEAYESIERWYEFYYGEEPDYEYCKNQRHMLFLEMCEGLHLARNAVFRKRAGIPSGFALTVEINDLVNKLYLRYCFIELTRRPLSDFRRYCYICCYGDDIIMSVNSELIQDFNFITIQKLLNTLNIAFTPASKDDRIYESLSIHESVFLKRNFVQHPFRRGVWLAPLPLDSCLECLNWKNKSISEGDYLYQAFRGALRALYSHGEDTFNLYRNRMLKIVACKINIIFPYDGKADLPTWSDLDEELFGGL